METTINNYLVSVESAKLIYDSLLNHILPLEKTGTSIYLTEESWTDSEITTSLNKIILPDDYILRLGDLIICKNTEIYKVTDISDDNINCKATGVSVRGKDGEDGLTPSFSIGVVETLAAGSNATASITGTDEYPILNLGIPRGANGTSSGGGTGGEADGVSPTIEVSQIDGGHSIAITDINGTKNFSVLDGVTPNITIGTVETLSPGSNATATLTGTTENPVLNLGIPRGADGSGETSGDEIPSHTHFIEEVKTSDGIGLDEIIESLNAEIETVKYIVDPETGEYIERFELDTEMSDDSVRAVQNKAIKAYIDGLFGNVEAAISEINIIIGG